MGSQHKKKKGTEDTRIIVADIKDDTDLWSNKGALQPAYEGNTYIVQSRTMTDFVNITETTDAAQTAGAPPVSPPGQTVGLTVTPISSSQLNLAWTASTAPDLANYKVYRGPTGFTEGPSFLIASPIPNSYSNTGLAAGTIYYYRASAIDIYGQEGTASTQAQGTTTGSPPAFTPNFWLELNSTFGDSSGNGTSIFGFNTNGFVTPGQFGSAGWHCNSPIENVQEDLLRTTTGVTAVAMDTSVGFSVSLWIYPTDLSALANRRIIITKADDSTNMYEIEIDSAGIAYFFVRKAGTDYKRQKTGFTLNTWQHIAATFNGATNVVEIYRDAVAGVASVATPEFLGTGVNNTYLIIGNAMATQHKFEGDFDEVQYFKSRVLTPTQVTNLKNTNAP